MCLSILIHASQSLHELLVPVSRQARKPQHISITETPVDARQAVLSADPSSVLTCQEVCAPLKHITITFLT